MIYVYSGRMHLIFKMFLDYQNDGQSIPLFWECVLLNAQYFCSSVTETGLCLDLDRPSSA